MKFIKHHRNDDQVVVKIISSSGKREDIVIRNTYEKVKLEGKEYFRYQIIEPKRFEKEEIIHRVGQSYEELVCSVCIILAGATSWHQEKTLGKSSMPCLGREF